MGSRRIEERITHMATIGSVTKRPDGRYEGELRTRVRALRYAEKRISR